MFLSTLLLIPWIIFGFRNSHQRFAGLYQTKKSLLTLLIIEVAYFIILILLLGDPDPNSAGSGSFAWMYSFVYEKGIFPLFIVTENFNPYSDAIIDLDYKWLYLLTALLMDYIVLFLISPNWKRLKARLTKSNSTAK